MVRNEKAPALMPSGESASPRPNVRNDSAGMKRESPPAVAVRTGGKESVAAFHGRLSGHSVVRRPRVGRTRRKIPRGETECKLPPTIVALPATVVLSGIFRWYARNLLACPPGRCPESLSEDELRPTAGRHQASLARNGTGSGTDRPLRA